MAWKALADRWEPKKEVNKQTLTNELFSLKLDDVSKDPEKWILQLLEKQAKLQEMNEVVSDGLLMSHILGNLPKEYEHVADNLARDPNKTITSVTDELKEKFERMKISGTVDDSEKALTGFKKFSGNCNYCGKQGHKSAQCFKKQQAEKSKDNKSGNGNGKFQGTCHHCGKKGHKKNDCFKLKNESKKDKVEDSGAVVLMAEDYYEDEFFDDWHTGPNEQSSGDKIEPILILDHEESLGSYCVEYDEPCEKERWWADSCESNVSSDGSGPIFTLDDDEVNTKEIIDINDNDDDDGTDDDNIPDLVSRAEISASSKETDRKVTKPGELMYMDTSSIHQTSMGGKKYWFLFVDGYSDLSISRFGKHKSDLPKIGVDTLLDLKTKGITVKSIRCDNAGENKAFEQHCKQKGLLVNFEYTAPGTPQQNGVVKRKFATLFGKVRAMNTAAGLQGDIRSKLWAEAANCATDLDCLLIREPGGTSPFELFYGYKAPYSLYLRTFGEIGIIRNITTVKPKLDDRGTPAMFLGYTKQHAGSVYRMLDLGTHRLQLSRDVEWLSKSYQEYITPQVENGNPHNREDDEYEEDDSQFGIGEEVRVNEINSTSENQITDGEWQEVRAGRDRLIFQPTPTGQTRSGSNYKANTAMLAQENDEEFIDSNEEYADIQAYVLYAEGKFEEPKSFEEAWNHTDEDERKGWREAIRKEFHDMNTRKVWRKFKKNQIPNHRRLIGCKWVFKKKKDGRYRARLCALGYSQIPGEDFTDPSSPVVDDITVRIVITHMIVNNWENEILDITTAFLHGDMEEEVYMKCPEGIDLIEEGWNLDDDCVELLKTIYGTKQAARQYWKKFMSFMEKRGFQMTHSEPCLLKRTDHNGTVVICVYVDDCLLTGDRKAIDSAIRDIESGFETRKLGPLEEYIGCSLMDLPDGNKKLIQPDMIKKIEKEYGDAVSYLKNVNVPMASGTTVIRPTEDDPLLSPEDQKDFRSAVGMLLYLVKHSRPDLSNAVRELSKVMSGATNDHVKLLHQVIKFVLETKDRGILVKPNKHLGVTAYCDSDFAGDKGNRRSITGFLIYLHDVPIAWKSKQQGGVTLSSSKAEYYAVSEVAMELKFVKMILDFLGVHSDELMKVYVDNIGAIHLANNASTGTRTKHIDTRIHFVRELTQGEDKIMEIEFVRSEENQSDTFTKNTPNGIFWTHTSRYMTDD